MDRHNLIIRSLGTTNTSRRQQTHPLHRFLAHQWAPTRQPPGRHPPRHRSLAHPPRPDHPHRPARPGRRHRRLPLGHPRPPQPRQPGRQHPPSAAHQVVHPPPATLRRGARRLDPTGQHGSQGRGRHLGARQPRAGGPRVVARRPPPGQGRDGPPRRPRRDGDVPPRAGRLHARLPGHRLQGRAAARTTRRRRHRHPPVRPRHGRLRRQALGRAHPRPVRGRHRVPAKGGRPGREHRVCGGLVQVYEFPEKCRAAVDVQQVDSFCI